MPDKNHAGCKKPYTKFMHPAWTSLASLLSPNRPSRRIVRERNPHPGHPFSPSPGALTGFKRSNIPYLRILPHQTLNPFRAARRAFTLFEVMLASGVMATGLVGMIQVVISGTEMLDVARKQTLATNIIHSQIDLYRASVPTDWSTVSTGTTTITLSSTTFSAVTSGFTCTRVVSNAVVNGSTVTTLKKVTFTVTWTGVTGRSYSRTGVTYIGRYGSHVSLQRT